MPVPIRRLLPAPRRRWQPAATPEAAEEGWQGFGVVPLLSPFLAPDGSLPTGAPTRPPPPSWRRWVRRSVGLPPDFFRRSDGSGWVEKLLQRCAAHPSPIDALASPVSMLHRRSHRRSHLSHSTVVLPDQSPHRRRSQISDATPLARPHQGSAASSRLRPREAPGSALPQLTAAMTRLLQRGAPHGERGSSAYMSLTPVFRDGAAGVQHHGRTEAGQIPGHADAGTYKGFSTPSTEAPTQLLPVLDIASTSLFWSCRSIGLRESICFPVNSSFLIFMISKSLQTACLLSEQNTSLKIR